MLRIKEILQEKGLSASALQRLMSDNNYQLSDISIRNIINGKHSPKLETLQQIANTLGIDIREMFTDNTKDSQPIYIKKENGKFKKIGMLNIKLKK